MFVIKQLKGGIIWLNGKDLSISEEKVVENGIIVMKLPLFKRSKPENDRGSW